MTRARKVHILGAQLLLGCVLCALPARAAEQGRIAVFHDDVTVRVFLQMPILPLGIKANKIDNETEAQEELRDDAELSYLPNLRLNAGAAVYYKGFGGSFSQQVLTISDTNKRGITKCTDIRFYEYYRKFGADLIYLDYDGFHLTDAKSHDLDAGDPLTIRDDIRLRMVQANAYYVLSDDFSLQAAFTQTEQQRHWDWTLLFLVSGMQQKLDADASLILPQYEAAYGNEAGFRGGVFQGVAAGAGLGLAIPWGNYCLTGMGMFGSGLMQREFECDKGTRHEYDGFYRIIARASAGYNNRQYFCGAAFLYDGTANYSGLRVLFNTYTIELYCGFRI